MNNSEERRKSDDRGTEKEEREAVKKTKVGMG